MQKEIITVFQAGSLSIPFLQIAKAFENKYPKYIVKMENSGSIKAAKKIYEEGKHADVLASADYKVIDNLLIPKYAKFNAQFSTNEMVIAYTKNAKYAKEITNQNWPEIFLRDDVKIAHTNPNLDPCGYRSILVTKLAEKFYNIPNFYNNLLGYEPCYKEGSENKNKIIVRDKESELLRLIQENKYDYLYIYKSVAKQHNLEYITLSKEVSLKDNENKEFYKTVSFNINGKEEGSFITKDADAMIYGITIIENDNPSKDKTGAIKFVNYVLSKEGQDIMSKNGQGKIDPVIITGDDSILSY
ncbi:tungstate ABC transporter substrate-binding protein WtpA [Poseidonibacter antarcticus]|uniref:tungstate ABC transporter substrate-binding protein WtpA n=1 Tax=Poseidonibacter antarcticus TaxID=2478538 RepID=UPI000EF4E6E1|nr:tungstate ABC transporter substrate-binding protein WtpA [Poseidonibacter antarcticus]